MKILFWFLSLLGLTATAALAGTTGYYDWSNGQPVVIIDSTDTTATTTIDWSNGQPTAVEVFVQEGEVDNNPVTSDFWLKSGNHQLKSGNIVIK